MIEGEHLGQVSVLVRPCGQEVLAHISLLLDLSGRLLGKVALKFLDHWLLCASSLDIVLGWRLVRPDSVLLRGALFDGPALVVDRLSLLHL